MMATTRLVGLLLLSTVFTVATCQSATLLNTSTTGDCDAILNWTAANASTPFRCTGSIVVGTPRPLFPKSVAIDGSLTITAPRSTNTPLCILNLTVSGDVTILHDTLLCASDVPFEWSARNFFINATLDGRLAGFLANKGPGVATLLNPNTTMGMSGGAGHGGAGQAQNAAAGGAAYDDLMLPRLPGSGGAGGSSRHGGGGAIRLHAYGTVSISGQINVDGAAGSELSSRCNPYPNCASTVDVGGSSGGTIFINASTLELVGNLSSLSAAGGSANFGGFGAGSGGRIAVHVRNFVPPAHAFINIAGGNSDSSSDGFLSTASYGSFFSNNTAFALCQQIVQPCRRSGTCSASAPSTTTLSCVCPVGYVGVNCETRYVPPTGTTVTTAPTTSTTLTTTTSTTLSTLTTTKSSTLSSTTSTSTSTAPTSTASSTAQSSTSTSASTGASSTPISSTTSASSTTATGSGATSSWSSTSDVSATTSMSAQSAVESTSSSSTASASTSTETIVIDDTASASTMSIALLTIAVVASLVSFD